ncbi:hypothetical protein [Aeoliella mucimassa]|uniref:Uncharacterized protein n=1 Tax=Aeoliella mucimassa TaxID=2527972 RepID=A0A518ATG4_9BACT|nr:hypothetical protein [Aeoliella mucimassa]QDU58024.1 hypothetical protein Pan181_42490 [Aeoliella mucimassa]
MSNSETTSPSDDFAPSGGFRISLKWMLLLLLVIGAGGGLLGRAFFWHPQVFQAVVGLLATIVPFVLAIGTLIVLGIRQRRKSIALWGAMLACMPVLGFGMLFLSEYLNSGGMGVLSTKQLIAQRLPQQFDEPWVWNELTSRLAAGKLTAEQVDDAIDELANQMTASKPNGWDSPLSWQGDFVEQADAAGMISDASLFALCDAFYGTQAKLDPLPRLREGKPSFNVRLNFGSPWGGNSRLPLELAWHLQAIRIDGEAVEFRENHRGGQDWMGVIEGDFEKGEYKAEFDIVAAYIDRDKLLGVNASRLKIEQWPKPRQRWGQTVEGTLEVFGPQDKIVALSTDSADAPLSGAVRIERLVIQPDVEGKCKVVMKIEYGEVQTTPLSFDVEVAIGDEVIEMGRSYYVTFQQLNGTSTSFLKSIPLLYAAE